MAARQEKERDQDTNRTEQEEKSERNELGRRMTNSLVLRSTVKAVDRPRRAKHHTNLVHIPWKYGWEWRWDGSNRGSFLDQIGEERSRSWQCACECPSSWSDITSRQFDQWPRDCMHLFDTKARGKNKEDMRDGTWCEYELMCSWCTMSYILWWTAY